MSNYRTKAKRRILLICSSSRCLVWDPLASAQLVQHVVLLIGQALLDAGCGYTIKPTYAGLDNSVLYAAQPCNKNWPYQMQLHTRDYLRTSEACKPCRACSNRNIKIAAESIVYLKQRCSLWMVSARCCWISAPKNNRKLQAQKPSSCSWPLHSGCSAVSGPLTVLTQWLTWCCHGSYYLQVIFTACKTETVAAGAAQMRWLLQSTCDVQWKTCSCHCILSCSCINCSSNVKLRLFK